MKEQMDPWTTICVVKHNGKEVGRVAAAAVNAEAYINTLAETYGGLQIEYVQGNPSDAIFALHEMRKRTEFDK